MTQYQFLSASLLIRNSQGCHQACVGSLQMEERSQSNLRVKKNGGNKKQCNRKDSSEEEGDVASMKQKHDAVKGRMKGQMF